MARWAGVVVLRGPANWGFLPVVACVLAVVTVVAALCATHKTRKVDKTGNTSTTTSGGGGSMDSPTFKFQGRSLGRVIVNALSSKRLLLGRKWRRSEEEELKAYDRAATEEGNFVWQRRILMGERCQPPNFSGVIIYDDKGNLLPKFPPTPSKPNLCHPSLQADAQGKRGFTGV